MPASYQIQLNNDIGVKDLYQVLLDTRNMEIKLFWERSNYFLVLNSALAVGFFTTEVTKYTVILGTIGLLVAALWFLVCLGSKYWQTRWEQRLSDFEAVYLKDLNFFSADAERIKSDVEKGIASANLRWPQRAVYRIALKSKPSVSYSMIRLSVLFLAGWLALIIVSVV